MQCFFCEEDFSEDRLSEHMESVHNLSKLHCWHAVAYFSKIHREERCCFCNKTRSLSTHKFVDKKEIHGPFVSDAEKIEHLYFTRGRLEMIPLKDFPYALEFCEGR